MDFFQSAEDRRRVASRPEPGSELSRLKFLPHQIGLGEVRPGSVVEQEISYQNQGEHSLTVRLDSAPAWIGVDQSLFAVEPGGEGTLKLAVFTGSLDGKVSGTVYLTVTGGQAGQVSEEKKILLSMEVVSPLVVTPRVLLLHGGSRHELRLRNNTDRELEIRKIIVPGKFLKVERSSDTEGEIPAHGYLDLPVRWYPEETPKDWAGGEIELVLEQPLPSGSSSITVSVLRVP